MRARVWLAVGAVLGLVAGAEAGDRSEWTVEAPGGELAIVVRLGTSAQGAGGRLTYEVQRGKAGARAVVLAPSPLGVRRADQAFERGLRLTSAGPVVAIDEDYRRPHGKRSQVRHRARQQSLTFGNPARALLELTLRAADDGVAFRYRFPEETPSVHRLAEEFTGFHLPSGTRAWMMAHNGAYEDYFNEVPAGTASPRPSGWAFPALFKVDGGRHWVLVSEAGVEASHCGSRLAAEAPGGVYRVRLPDAREGDGVGEVEPASTLPWALPWRVVIVGSLATVAESTLIEDLSPASVVADTSWIKPGRASWSWWSDPPSPKNEAALKSFVDLAAEMRWEYSLIDANWNEMEAGSVPRILAHAREKGVGILLWYNSGGPHNRITEAPRDRMHLAQARRAEFAKLREWGVKGVKVDFWHSDKQDRIQQYLDLMRDAAEYHLLVNFHGSTLPRGWSRTYPHLMTMEGVRGAEQYMARPEYPETAVWHNTVLPFTRNAVGPMDYTPVTFTDRKHPRLTTDGHELALSVVFESGIQHLADSPAGYRSLPEPAREFLKAVPAAWDETRLLAGEPGLRAVFARRAGEVWYLGGINGQTAPEELELDLRFLPPGPHRLTVITDGSQPRGTLTASQRAAKAGDRVRVPLLARGGFVARLERER